MARLRSGTANVGSVEAWLSVLTQQLQELLGNEGAQAVLCKALVDAKRQRPELGAVTIKQDGLDLSTFYTGKFDEGIEYIAEGESLNVLMESLRLLLVNLLGDELTSQVVPVITVNEESNAAVSYPSPFFDSVKNAPSNSSGSY